MRRLLALTATVTALAAGIAVAPSARADSQDHSDPRNDTVVLNAGRLASVAPGVDVTRVRTVYEGQKVKVVLTLADLGVLRADDFTQYVARARSGQEDWLFGIIKVGAQVQPLIQPTGLMRRGYLLRPTAGRGTDDCAPKYDIDKRADTVTLVATRACLGAGASVRTGGLAAAMLGETTNRYRVDDGRRKGRASTSPDRLKLGPAVDRN